MNVKFTQYLLKTHKFTKKVSFFINMAVLSLITKTETLYFLLIEVEPK